MIFPSMVINYIYVITAMTTPIPTRTLKYFERACGSGKQSLVFTEHRTEEAPAGFIRGVCVSVRACARACLYIC